jgi:dTDP-L-rhamnose 4-epimerase
MDVPQIRPQVLGKARSGDIRNCFADTAKAGDMLGFAPRFRLENALGEMADWVRLSSAVDRSDEMRRQLEERGLVT